MKKLGFTLVELLAVLVILGVLLAIIIPVTNGLINNSRQAAYDSQINSILREAEKYSISNNLGYQNYLYKELYFEDLLNEGLITELPINPLTDEVLEGCILYSWKREEANYDFIYDVDCDPSDENAAFVLSVDLVATKSTSNGWVSEDYQVNVNHNGTAYKYCIGDSECVPDMTEGTISINTSGIHTVCAIVTDDILESSVHCEEFKLDKTKPILTAKNESFVILTGTETYSKDYFTSSFGISGGVVTCIPANTSALGVGNQTLTCTATGNNGLKTTTTKNIEVISNTVDLTLSASKTAANGWVSSDYVINVNHSGTSYKYCMGTNCTPNQTGTININTNGTHVVCVVASNALVSSEKVCGTYKLDKTTPVLTAKTDSFTITNGTNSYSKDYFNSSFGPSSGIVTCTPANTNILGVGNQTLTCTATGNNGLKTTTTKNIEVISNTVDLTLSASKTAANGWVSSDYVINVNHSGTSYKYCMGTNCTPNQTGTININTNGTHTVCAIASNELVSSNKVCGTYKLDKTTPTIEQLNYVNLVEPVPSLETKNFFNYSFGISGGNVNCNFNYTNELPVSQVQEVTCTATGNNGLTASSSTLIKVVSPSIAIDLMPSKTTDNGWVNSDYYVNIVHSYEGLHHAYCLVEGENNNCEPYLTGDVTVLDDGFNVIRVDINQNGIYTLCAISTNELFGSDLVCETFKLDKEVPVISAKSNSVSILEGTNSNIVDYFNYSFGPSGGSVNCNKTNTNSLNLGNNRVLCEAISNSGLSSIDDVNINVTTPNLMVSGSEFQSKIGNYRKTISEVNFYSTKSVKYDNASIKWDFSENNNEVVVGYIENVDGKQILNIEANGNIIAHEQLGGTCYYGKFDSMFCLFEVVEEINFNGNLDTSNVKNMYNLFDDNNSLRTLDLSSFNTSNVINMSSMFSGTSSLINLDLSSFYTSNVINMSSMFSDTRSLTHLDLSNFDTSNVTDMRYMFSDTRSLINVDVSSFDTSNVTDMSSLFDGASSLTNLNVEHFDTSNVIDMSYMFASAENLISLDLSSWNTSSLTEMAGMFDSTENLVSLNVSNWDISNVESLDTVFSASGVENLDLSTWNTSNVVDMEDLFSGAWNLKTLNVSTWNTSNVTNISGMFAGTAALTTLDISNFDTSNVINMSSMFSSTRSLTHLDLSNFDTSKVTSMSYMFSSSYVLIELDLKNFDTSNVTNMSSMFSNARSLTNLNVSSFDTSNVTSMSSMFSGARSLTNLDVSSFDTSNVTNMSYMFYNTYSLDITYARTQTDADKFNSSIGKYSGVNFIVKP